MKYLQIFDNGLCYDNSGVSHYCILRPDSITMWIAQSAGAVEYSNCISAEG